MSEPVVINAGTTNVIIDLSDVRDSTGLRELADWLDAQPTEHMVLAISNVYDVNHATDPLSVGRSLSALVEDLDSPNDMEVAL